MMRAFAVLSLVALSACVTSNTSTTTVQPARSQGSVGMTITPSSSVAVRSVPFALELVWRTMPAVYDSLKIPLNTLDAKTHTIGNDGFKTRKQLGTVPLSRYIECGTTQIGPNADSYDVVLTVLTQLQSDASAGGATKITMTVEAAAKPIAFAQEYSRCTSRGLLESRLVDIVNARLQR